MSEEKHTPLPWTVGKIEHGGLYPIWAKVGHLDVQPATAHGLPEAELIVRSVNALSALVKALEEAREYFRLLSADNMIAEDGLEVVDAALSSLRAEQR